MSSESGDRRPPARILGSGTKPPEPEQLPCPRCDSTNTKFCYYNNYNLSQPRYFCKSCRRYWTKGGTLRNVPVGGGTRKSSSHKRPRTTTTTTTTATATATATTSSSSHVNNNPHEEVLNSIPVSIISDMGHGSGPGTGLGLENSGPLMGCDVNLNEALPDTESFSSLLGNGFMSLQPGYGLGIGIGPGLHGMGYGLGMLDWPIQQMGQGDGGGAAASGGGGGGNVSGCNTWQMGGVEGGLGDGDIFGWPDLAISTPSKGLK